ncbi:MAG: hypothetical protein ABR509_08775 [Candidatus Limnocylindria bacterium]
MSPAWWQTPLDALGALAASIAPHAPCRGVGGALLFEDDRYDRLFRLIPTHPTAMTFGSTIVARRSLDEATVVHELTHVDQYRRFGPLYLALYVLGAAWGQLRHGDLYHGNPFEARAVRAAHALVCHGPRT